MFLILILVILALLCIFKIYLVTTNVTYVPKISMKGKTIIITGANSGLGKETALALAKLDARIIMACRNLKTAQSAKDEIMNATNNHKLIIKPIDLSSQQSVRKFAADIIATEKKIDVLIHNAGLTVFSKNLKSVDGIEMTMATNHYGPYLLTHLLIDLLKQSAPSRIVVMSSIAHNACSTSIDLNPINSKFPYYIYFKSKLANIFFTQELARRLQGTGVTANCLHPGVVNTDIFECIDVLPTYWFFYLVRRFLITAQQGAQTTTFLAVAEEVAGISGKYFKDCKVQPLWKYHENVEKQRQFWKDSQTMAGLRCDDPNI